MRHSGHGLILALITLALLLSHLPVPTVTQYQEAPSTHSVTATFAHLAASARVAALPAAGTTDANLPDGDTPLPTPTAAAVAVAPAREADMAVTGPGPLPERDAKPATTSAGPSAPVTPATAAAVVVVVRTAVPPLVPPGSVTPATLAVPALPTAASRPAVAPTAITAAGSAGGTAVAVPATARPGADDWAAVEPARAAAPPAPAASPPAPTLVPAWAGFLTYEVQPGDTLSSLAGELRIEAADLVRANDLAATDLLTPGREIYVGSVRSVEHEVKRGERLTDIAGYYGIDLPLLLGVNHLPDPTAIRTGQRLIVPATTKTAPAATLAAIFAPPPVPDPPRQLLAAAGPGNSSARPFLAALSSFGLPAGRGGEIVRDAIQFLGYQYVWGGTSPEGFDCSGFVWYVHRLAGRPVPRDLFSQLNGRAVAPDDLQPGDTLFFENTYMPGPSHNGIYIGNGQFVHAADEQHGVMVSDLTDPYWDQRVIGATRLY